MIKIYGNAWHSSYQIKKYKNKIIYDQLAHIGRGGYRTVLSSTKMKVTLPKEASGQVWSGFYRNAAGFTGILHGQINFVSMMHSD